MNKNSLYRLSGKVQHYQWGGAAFIPELLGVENSRRQPFAEYWLGAHENHSSILTETGTELNACIRLNPSVLGAQAEQEFKRLPYLLKVLDVKDMLSIQVHPSKHSAAKEFERENNEGIDINASHRNYKDDNHKPELMLALSDFWLLHGFKAEGDIRSAISGIPEFDFMMSLFDEGGYQKLYKALMEADQQRIDDILHPLLARIVPLYNANELRKDDANFWAARAALTFNEPGKVDRGIFSIYLLNLVHLKKGEAIFQDAGVLHAYLEGQNMEIMANSDNVLRGGLTPKHIDVNELMKHVKFEAVVPHIIYGTPVNECEKVYLSPAPDFQLSQIVVRSRQRPDVRPSTTEIFMVMEGSLKIQASDGTVLQLNRGEAAVAFAGSQLQLSTPESSVVFRASLPGIQAE